MDHERDTSSFPNSGAAGLRNSMHPASKCHVGVSPTSRGFGGSKALSVWDAVSRAAAPLVRPGAAGPVQAHLLVKPDRRRPYVGAKGTRHRPPDLGHLCNHFGETKL